MDLKWYLVKTKPLNESRIYKRLTEAGFESIYPKILKKIRGKGRVEIRPLFPTYLFVNFAIEQLRTVRYTRGVARVISFGPDPQEVDASIIDTIRARMNEEGIVELIKPPMEWKRGEKIKIGEGPFAGLDAIFVEALPDRERVVLLLDAVSSFRVILNKDAIEGTL
jgi:transcriptional antiterminator RfaH